MAQHNLTSRASNRKENLLEASGRENWVQTTGSQEEAEEEEEEAAPSLWFAASSFSY